MRVLILVGVWFIAAVSGYETEFKQLAAKLFLFREGEHSWTAAEMKGNYPQSAYSSLFPSDLASFQLEKVAQLIDIAQHSTAPKMADRLVDAWIQQYWVPQPDQRVIRQQLVELAKMNFHLALAELIKQGGSFIEKTHENAAILCEITDEGMKYVDKPRLKTIIEGLFAAPFPEQEAPNPMASASTGIHLMQPYINYFARERVMNQRPNSKILQIFDEYVPKLPMENSRSLMRVAFEKRRSGSREAFEQRILYAHRRPQNVLLFKLMAPYMDGDILGYVDYLKDYFDRIEASDNPKPAVFMNRTNFCALETVHLASIFGDTEYLKTIRDFMLKDESIYARVSINMKRLLVPLLEAQYFSIPPLSLLKAETYSFLFASKEQLERNGHQLSKLIIGTARYLMGRTTFEEPATLLKFFSELTLQLARSCIQHRSARPLLAMSIVLEEINMTYAAKQIVNNDALLPFSGNDQLKQLERCVQESIKDAINRFALPRSFSDRIRQELWLRLNRPSKESIEGLRAVVRECNFGRDPYFVELMQFLEILSGPFEAPSLSDVVCEEDEDFVADDATLRPVKALFYKALVAGLLLLFIAGAFGIYFYYRKVQGKKSAEKQVSKT